MLRKDPALLGRVQEQLWRERKIREARRAINYDQIGEAGAQGLEELAAQGGAGEEVGKKKKRARRRVEDVVEVEGVSGKSKGAES